MAHELNRTNAKIIDLAYKYGYDTPEAFRSQHGVTPSEARKYKGKLKSYNRLVLSTLDIPASKWAVFEVHGSMPEAMPKVWKQIFSEWFPSSRL